LKKSSRLKISNNYASFEKAFSSNMWNIRAECLFLVRYIVDNFMESTDYLILLVLLKSPILAFIGYKLS